jgi:hypothetical protein
VLPKMRFDIQRLLSAAYKVLTIEEFEASVSDSGPEGPLFTTLIVEEKFGAGEGIRTPDPNLGKVGSALFRLLPHGSRSLLNVDKATLFKAWFGSGRSSTIRELLPHCFPHASPAPFPNPGKHSGRWR